MIDENLSSIPEEKVDETIREIITHLMYKRDSHPFAEIVQVYLSDLLSKYDDVKDTSDGTISKRYPSSLNAKGREMVDDLIRSHVTPTMITAGKVDIMPVTEFTEALEKVLIFFKRGLSASKA